MSEILSTTLEQFEALPEHKQQALKLKPCTTGDIKDGLGLKVRILEYIYVNSLHNIPVTLADINRRYSRPAKRYGTTTNTVVHELIDSNKVCILERNGISAAFSTQLFNDIDTRRNQTLNPSRKPLVDILIGNITTYV